MRLAIHTSIWKRHKLARLMLEWLNDIAGGAALCDEVFIVASCSPVEDPEGAALAHEYADVVTEARNEPLGAKHNTAGRAAYELGCDAMMTLGSDDFITGAWMRQAIADIEDGAHVSTLTDVAFMLPPDGHVRQWNAWPQWTNRGMSGPPRSIGAGRCYSRAFMSEREGAIWDPSRNRVLDRSVYDHTKDKGYWDKMAAHAATDGRALLDVKWGGCSITPPGRIRGVLAKSEILGVGWVLRHFGTEVDDRLTELWR